ncbi:MAG TPA: endonuclease/exonuclease/phosphatase family protein [Steroidobacteraceae bacterium]|nr:endonuclease/exonuclease/phosphatase family protein [Steroidobacteraceae bacterium]
MPPPARMLERLAVLAAAATGAATLLAASARDFWLGDLAVHFRPQYAALGVLAALLLAARRRWGWALAATLVVLLNAALAAPVLLARATPTRMAPPQEQVRARALALSVASINVLYSNPHYERVIAWLRVVRPDAVVLVEVTPAWRQALEALRDVYPQQYYTGPGTPRGHGHGTLLLSRWPLTQPMTLPLGPHADPAVSAVLEMPARRVHLLGVHPSWPIGPGVSAERNRELAWLASLSRATATPLIVAGDLNITPFSPHFAQLLRASGLEDAAHGAGWQPTWPTFLPLAGIAIDHVLYSRDLAVVRCARGPRIGSDHWPLLVDLTGAAE